RIPLKVGLVYRDAQRQQASVELLRSLLEGVI
ncbi:LysR family transcriptional regulator, partial [Pseudomonas aeruginosa]